MTLNIYYYNFQVSSKFWFVYNCQIYINIILILLFRSTTTDTPQLGQRPFKLTTLYCLLLFWLIGIYYWRTKCVDKIVIFDVTNVEAKMRFYWSLKWIRSTDAPTLLLDEVVCCVCVAWALFQVSDLQWYVFPNQTFSWCMPLLNREQTNHEFVV